MGKRVKPVLQNREYKPVNPVLIEGMFRRYFPAQQVVIPDWLEKGALVVYIPTGDVCEVVDMLFCEKLGKVRVKMISGRFVGHVSTQSVYKLRQSVVSTIGYHSKTIGTIRATDEDRRIVNRQKVAMDKALRVLR